MRKHRAVLLALVVVVLVGACVAAVRVPWIRDAVREPVTMAAVALFVRPFEARGEWREGAATPSEMLEPAAAVVGGKLYVFGGFVTTARANEFPATTRVNVYDPATDTWSRAGDMPLAVTHAHAVVVDDEVWFAGGFVGDDPGVATATVRRYRPDDDRWLDGPRLPRPVAGGTLAVIGRTLHYVGGFAADRDTVVDDHWAFPVDDHGGGAWRSRAPLPTPRGHLASAVVEGRLYAIGGQVRHDTDPVDLDVVEIYDDATDAWTRAAPLPTPRSHVEAATFVQYGRIVVVGGRNNTASVLLKGAGLADVLVYTPDADDWATRPGLPFGIESAVARPIDGRLVVTGGATFGDVAPQRRTLVGAVP